MTETKIMTEPKIIIELESANVTVTTFDELGLKTVKHTNVENIQQIFMKEQAMETPLLPSQWGVVKYYRKNHFEGYVLTTPAAEREVTFDIRRSDVPKKAIVPVPPMVWAFEVSTEPNGNKKLTHSMSYVIMHELLSLKDTVLHSPFPNIGTNHGICWGSFTPDVPSPKSLQNIPARFFSQPFNSDLASDRVKSFPNLNGESTSALYHMVEMSKRLERAKENNETFSYPFDTLKKAGTFDVEQIIRNTMPGIFD